ncbi:MAG: ribulose-phosphate 3-epimerase [Patescibacteria group bacterium]
MFTIIEIIPAILEKTFDQVAVKIKRIEKEAPKIKWVQLDIMDGKFVSNATWNQPEDLLKIKTYLNLEVHLMVDAQLTLINSWSKQNQIKRILVHKEAVRNSNQIVKLVTAIKQANREAGIVLNPSTPVESVKDYLLILDEVLLMAVEPGFSGQKFQNKILDKIRGLRQWNSQIPIGIDGGINLETAPLAIKAGASRLYAASFLWNYSDLGKAVLALQAL